METDTAAEKELIYISPSEKVQHVEVVQVFLFSVHADILDNVNSLSKLRCMH